MPIASGAAGRVDVGVDSSATWAPDGVRKTKPANRNCGSYLQRYQELKQKKKNKCTSLQGTQDNTDLSDNENNENDGAKEGNPQTNESSEDHTSGKLPSGGRSKKSRLCVLL